MAPDIGGEIEGEVTRVEAVKYLQGALGHAVGSLTFLLAAAVFLVFGYSAFAWLSVLSAALLSANGLSIWGWERLQTHFAAQAAESEPTRSLTANPLSTESVVEMKAGAVMLFAFLAVLLVAGSAVQYLDPRAVGVASAVCLAVGNGVALLRAVRTGG
ncbi:hypothetical protein [Halobacterium bonnevillei]|uniref:Uncharacterized protein n=1 Tax=Halobacterium bonnevillei TaxID=2692200 RepID=A0A6B0SFD4_9EURY|nr:hypothetical protein [Halobacterium bonnevillei]MXR20484.1 hypothetical protein [Halobacterium bonnevillei]